MHTFSEITELSIAALVDRFYSKARRDELGRGRAAHEPEVRCAGDVLVLASLVDGVDVCPIRSYETKRDQLTRDEGRYHA